MNKKIVNNLPNFGLAFVLVWIGCMKFTDYEAQAIQGLIKNSPFISWIYSILSVGATAKLIGLSELVTAFLISLKPVNKKLALVGGVISTSTFALTSTFLFSTPGVWEKGLGGFPALSVMPGQFLVKDFALLGISLWITLSTLEEIKTAKD